MTPKCATPSCESTAGLEPVAGAEGLICRKCREELRRLVEQVRREAIERDEANAKWRML